MFGVVILVKTFCGGCRRLCHPGVFGDVISWPDLATDDRYSQSLSLPSKCDGEWASPRHVTLIKPSKIHEDKSFILKKIVFSLIDMGQKSVI